MNPVVWSISQICSTSRWPLLSSNQAYSQHGAHFRTTRRGYLGCFPTDGLTHPLLLSLVRELEASAPAIFGRHRLALWWLFKYDESNSEGIGIHADPAAVNINLWLTADEACIEGGGLVIYKHVPALETHTLEVNHEFGDGEERALRAELAKEGVFTVPYRCNRAVIFVSDQYHESLPFRFASGYENRRVNLTLLFGDRWAPVSPRGHRPVSREAPGCDEVTSGNIGGMHIARWEMEGRGKDEEGEDGTRKKVWVTQELLGCNRGRSPELQSNAQLPKIGTGGWDVFD